MDQSLLNHKTGALVLAAGNRLNVIVSGCSMEPAIKYLQTVSVSNITKLRCGHCYLFEVNNHLMLHRLATVVNGVCCFIGDNSSTVERVNTELVIGEVMVPHCSLSKRIITLLNKIYLYGMDTPLAIPSQIKKIRIISIRSIMNVDAIVRNRVLPGCWRLKNEKEI